MSLLEVAQRTYDRIKARPNEPVEAPPSHRPACDKSDRSDQRPPPGWDQAEADCLLGEAQARRRQLFGDVGWPEDDDACLRQAGLMDRFDHHWQARNLAGLRQAVGELLTLLAPPWDVPRADAALEDVQALIRNALARKPRVARGNVLELTGDLARRYHREHDAKLFEVGAAVEVLLGRWREEDQAEAVGASERKEDERDG
jgi:hypothetical protein